MLLLSRKLGEKLVIGSGITVTVLEVRGNRVKFGFTAPAGIAIQRKESPRAIEGPLPVLGHSPNS